MIHPMWPEYAKAALQALLTHSRSSDDTMPLSEYRKDRAMGAAEYADYMCAEQEKREKPGGSPYR